MAIGIRTKQPGLTWREIIDMGLTWAEWEAKDLTWKEFENYLPINWELGDQVALHTHEGTPVIVQIGAYGIESTDAQLDKLILAYDPTILRPAAGQWSDKFGLPVTDSGIDLSSAVSVTDNGMGQVSISFASDKLPDSRYSGAIADIAFDVLETTPQTTITLQ